MTEKLIHALQSPACYPHPVAGIHVLETHISWVLLTGDLAYKIKKPVNFGFLDFSTLAKRKHYCEEELRLNSRFSAGLYLAVVAITGNEESPRIDGEGPVLDYAVKMREFDQNDVLDSLAARNVLDTDDMRAIAEALAAFHRNRAGRLGVDDQQLGTVASVAGAALENFHQIAPRLTTDAARGALEHLRQWSVQQLAGLQDVFAQRRAQGFVRECHGDLHLRNIARIDGVITFFDCIEFNPQLRWIDVMSELAFLLMDMEEKQLRAQANRLLNFYLEYTGDYRGLAVLQFYKVYRALVRAKVLVLKVDGGKLAPDAEDKVWQEYAVYIQLAQSYCQPQRPFLVLMHGVSGTGKSTVAATLAAEFNAIRIRSDVERKRLFGLAPDARSMEDEHRHLYGETASTRTFAALEALADSLLGFGYPVFVDATFISAKWRDLFFQLAHRRQQPLVILDCQASATSIMQRLALRQSTQRDASDADIEVMRSQLASQEAFSAEERPHVVVIDTEREVNAAALRDHLAHAAHTPTRSGVPSGFAPQ